MYFYIPGNIWRNQTYCACVYNRSPVCVIWPNYEVVGFNPCSGITTSLDSVFHCYVPLSFLPWYYYPCFSHHMRSSAHLGVICHRPRISSYPTRLYAHLGVASSHPSIITSCCASPLFSSLVLFGYLAPLHPICFLQDFCKRSPNMVFWHLLAPPCIQAASSPLIFLLSYTHIKYWPQRNLMFHCPQLSSYVGHCLLSSHRFPH